MCNPALGPFVLGLALGPLAAALHLPGGEAWSAVGVIWIYYTQYLLYQRVNQLYKSAGMAEPLVVWWLVLPGFNLIIGLRQLHFLAAHFARERGETVPPPPPPPLTSPTPELLTRLRNENTSTEKSALLTGRVILVCAC